ncbi:MAG: hypothetical protein EOP49_01570 [Sphingobacteriales bacterium]|nr:MAG: hypothetical protein EOP49_01570 [Sphingobacteriales bacterium]
MSRLVLNISLISLLLFGCKREAVKPAPERSEEGTYFSVRDFAKDQFRTYWGQPFTLQKIAVLDGKRDSSLVNADKIEWPEIMKTFFAADISDPKFDGKYAFSMFDDDATVSRTYYYEALEPDLFTRKLQIMSDPFTDKIKSIYIETEKNGRFGKKAQKLYYSPVKVIQIQEFESSLLGSDRNLRVEYRFVY